MSAITMATVAFGLTSSWRGPAPIGLRTAASKAARFALQQPLEPLCRSSMAAEKVPRRQRQGPSKLDAMPLRSMPANGGSPRFFMGARPR